MTAASVAGLRPPGPRSHRPVEILPDHVANQIAAGEVVERPASVVRELAENALDAGARRIDVHVRGGGKAEIRVADDGCGMARDDAILAVERHATSKIRTAADLQRIRSLGFRGEALPSIAAVSLFQLHTAAENGDGVRVRVDFGKIRGVTPKPRAPGTTVSVRMLFRDIPARAKFLGTNATETRAAAQAVTLLALANPGAGFRFVSSGRVLLDVEPDQSGLERIDALWHGIGATLLSVNGGGRVGVRGFVQRPDAATKGGRRFLMVGNRVVSDPVLMRVVDEAYRTTTPNGARPAVFLRLVFEAGDVDVNVHPAKSEVRFRDRRAVETAVAEAIREALSSLESAHAISGRGHEGPGSADQEPLTLAHPAAAQPEVAALFEEAAGVEAFADIETAKPEIWQLHNRYILAPTREGMLIIDQHAAHERVLYERIMARFSGDPGETQTLLFPVPVRLSPDEMLTVEDTSGLLRRIGFRFEKLGQSTVVITEAPQPHPRFDGEACFRDMIRELTEGSPLVDSAHRQQDKIARSMACKGAIKAGDPLSPEEARELFDSLFATELPAHDVHGRPAAIRLATAELDRRFGRS